MLRDRGMGSALPGCRRHNDRESFLMHILGSHTRYLAVLFILAFGLCGLCSPSHAQSRDGALPDENADKPPTAFSNYFIDNETGDPLPPPDLDAVVDENYIIGPGDVLDIMAWGRLQALYTVEVSWDGTLMPYSDSQQNVEDFFTFWPGTVQIKGKTLREIQRLVDRAFQRYVKGDVHVTVKVKEPRVIKVQVMGQVNAPNEYRFLAGATLITALGAAGYTPDTSLRRITVLRRPTPNTTVLIDVDLYKYFVDYLVEENLILQNGDTIRVPFVDIAVTASGGVSRPAVYEILDGERIGDLLHFAGGFHYNGVPSKSYIERHTHDDLLDMLPVSLEFFNVSRRDDVEENLELKDGDTLFVPRNTDYKHYVKVFFDNLFEETEGSLKQDIKRQEIIPIPAGLTLLQLFDRLRDKLLNADLSSISIIRNGEKFKVNYLEIAAAPESDLLLETGDTLYIPRAVDFVYVLGEVNQPSMIKYGREASILEYIAQADGYKQSAKLAIVTVLHTESKTKELVDVKEWIRTGQAPDNGQVLPGDIIIVPENNTYKLRDYVDVFNSMIPMISFLELKD